VARERRERKRRRTVTEVVLADGMAGERERGDFSHPI
jgi:hypothetical protein